MFLREGGRKGVDEREWGPGREAVVCGGGGSCEGGGRWEGRGEEVVGTGDRGFFDELDRLTH